jgi:tetratricopeptide (TPR) repeat protein
MLFGPDPLGERLTSVWHNHFATSNEKVGDLAAMLQQNECFRKLARAPFGRLLREAIRDPALLNWLDAPVNRKGRPNENLARELLELFTLGVGLTPRSTSRKPLASSRAGLVEEGRFAESPRLHDDGPKTVLGRTGAWRGQDLLLMLLEQPATAQRLAGRLCELFLGEGMAGEAGIGALARSLRRQPDNPDANYCYARCLRLLGRNQEAEQLLDRLLASQPPHAKALGMRAELALDAGRDQEASELLVRAIELDPSNHSQKYSLFLCLNRLGKTQEAKIVEAMMAESAAEIRRMDKLVREVACTGFPRPSMSTPAIGPRIRRSPTTTNALEPASRPKNTGGWRRAIGR